jgi:hypothetical protein
MYNHKRLNASFLSKLRAKKVEKLVTRHKTVSTKDGLPEISKMKYRNRILEPGTTISGFADSYIKKKIIINADRPTLDFFDM